VIQGNLVSYHFATASDDEREAVEKHLVGCTACLRTYLALKTHVDRGARERDHPSEEARQRLRAAVEARFRATPARRLRGWLVRPVPLYQGLAAAAVVLAAVALGPAIAGVLRPPPAAHAAQRVDTARPVAESMTIY